MKWDSASKRHLKAVLTTRTYGKTNEIQIVSSRYLLKDNKYRLSLGWRIWVGWMKAGPAQRHWYRGSQAADVQRNIKKTACDCTLFFYSSWFWEHEGNFVGIRFLVTIIQSQGKTLPLPKLHYVVKYQWMEGLFNGKNQTSLLCGSREGRKVKK